MASVSLRKDCLARTEARVGSCARRAGGPWPCISFHSRDNFKRRLFQASVGHPIISRTAEFDATRRPFFTIALATDSWSRFSARPSAFVHESQTGLAYSRIGLTTVMNMCMTKPSARRWEAGRFKIRPFSQCASGCHEHEVTKSESQLRSLQGV